MSLALLCPKHMTSSCLPELSVTHTDVQLLRHIKPLTPLPICQLADVLYATIKPTCSRKNTEDLQSALLAFTFICLFICRMLIAIKSYIHKHNVYIYNIYTSNVIYLRFFKYCFILSGVVCLGWGQWSGLRSGL